MSTTTKVKSANRSIAKTINKSIMNSGDCYRRKTLLGIYTDHTGYTIDEVLAKALDEFMSVFGLVDLNALRLKGLIDEDMYNEFACNIV